MSILNRIKAYWNFDDVEPKDFKNQPYFKDATGRGNNLVIQPDQRPATSSIDFRIGANNHGNQQVDGAQAAWGIWKRKLTTSEKAALAGGETWPFSTTPSLADAAAYYLLNEASGSATYVDATGRGNDLTRSGTTTQVAGPSGITHGTQFTPGAYLHISPTADLQAGNVDHTICGWVKLNSKTVADQQIYWGQLDVNVSPAQTADVIYYEGTYDTFNVDLGNGVNTIGNGVAVVPTHPVIGQWYFLLTDYDAVSSAETLALDNGTASEFAHNYWSTGGGKVGSAASFRLQPDFRGTTGGWDTPNVPFLTAPNVPDLQFTDGKDKTFWCWFKADATSGSQIPIAGFYDFASGKINWLLFIGTNVLYFYAGNGTAGSSFVPALTAFTDTSSWHLAVCWYDSGSNTVNLDLDHGAFTSSVSLGAVVVTPSADAYMVVAANTDGAGFNNQFRGSLDEMGIAEGVPTSGDLDALWNSGAGISPKFPTSRLGLARLGRMRLGAAPVAAQEIFPDFIASTTQVFDPSLQFSPRRITPAGIPSRTVVPPPTLVPDIPDLKLHLYLGGVDISAYVQVKSMRVDSSASGRWTATVVLIDKTASWSGAPVIPTATTKGLSVKMVIVEGGAKIFSGFLNSCTIDRILSGNVITYTLGGIDMSGICDHRVYSGTFAVGLEIADCVRAVAAASLDGEGIALDGVPATIATLTIPETMNFVTVTQAFDRLALDGNCVWWVDEFNRLQFMPLSALPAAPFALTETSKNWRKLQVKVSLDQYRNKQYVVSNLSLNPNGVPSITESYTLPQARAAALGFRLATIVLNFSYASIVSLKVNGVSQAFHDGSESINFDKSWWGYPSPYLYGPDSTLPSTPPLPIINPFNYPAVISPFPIAGDVVEIEYVPDLKNAAITGISALPPPTGLVQAGSGIFEAVEQVKDINDPLHLKAVADAILARKGFVPYSVSYETDKPGLRVGQQQSINVPLMKIPSRTITITRVSGTHMYKNLGAGSGFRWTIEGNDGADFRNNIKWYEQLVARTENALPIVQFDEAAFILSPGSSISAGTVVTNPQIVSRSGRLIEVVAQAAVPPTNQDLEIDILNSAYGSIFGAAANRIVIVAGNTNLVRKLVFVTDPLWILVNQSLSISVSYINVGTSTARAGSVTVKARWAI